MKKHAAFPARPDSLRGFTLIELLVSIAIILCLMGMAAPTAQKVLDKAVKTACAQNLRQIGIASQLYAADHDENFPTIEPWPSEPIYTDDDNANTLQGALGFYGLSDSSLKCRADISGPNYFAKEGSSYCWCPMASGVKLTNPKLNFGGGGGPDVTLSRIMVAYDYDSVHDDSSNVLYGDGHVE